MDKDHEDQPKVWFDGYITHLEESLMELDRIAYRINKMIEEEKETCQKLRTQMRHLSRSQKS